MAAEKVTKAAPTAPNADKKRAIETAMAQIEKLYGKGSIMRCGDEQAANVEAISTGSLALDAALGIGGVPKGRIIEIYGPESSGKTTLGKLLAKQLGRTFVDLDDAIVKAVKAVDECVGEVVEAAKRNGYEVVQIADHGNADNAINADGTPNTAHSLNPVPIVVVSDRVKTVHDGVLADVAPTVLKLMGLEQPAEMTGKVLVELK